MPNASTFTGSVAVDTTSIKKLARDLRRADPLLAKKLRTRMKEAGGIVATEAKSRSSWSTRIPRSVRVSVTAYGSKVAVKAGGTKAPDGAVFEHRGKPGTFRHPVFGNTNAWVEQKARPFLAPAIDAKASEVSEAVAKAIDDTLHEVGFDE